MFIKAQLHSFLLYTFLFLFCIIYGAYIFALQSVVSFTFTLTFILLAILFVVYAKDSLDYLDYLCLSIIFVALICVLVNAMLGNILVSFSYLKKWMMFSSTIVFFDLTRKIQVNFSGLSVCVKFMCILLSFLTIYKYITGGISNYMINGLLSVDLKMNFENSNKLALFLMPIFFMNVISFRNETISILKIMFFTLAGFILYFIFETGSRSCVLSIIFFVLFFLFFIINKQKKITFFFSFFISLFPLLWALTYLATVNNKKILDFFDFAQREGKSLNSRAEIWNNVIDKFNASPFLGVYNEISNGTGMSQCHNSHIDVLASYGSISFILFIVFLICILKSVKLNNVEQRINFSIFVALLFCGTGEAALFSGGTGLYIAVGLFLLQSYQTSNNESLNREYHI